MLLVFRKPETSQVVVASANRSICHHLDCAGLLVPARLGLSQEVDLFPLLTKKSRDDLSLFLDASMRIV